MDKPDHEPVVTGAESKRWAWHRQPDEREDPPQPGDVVLFRTEEWASPVPAVVTEVQNMIRHNDGHGGSHPDPHVWDENGLLRPDPWPWVTLRLGDDGTGREVRSKEARVRGSAGWLRPGSRWAPAAEGKQ